MRMMKCTLSTIVANASWASSRVIPEKEIFKKGYTDRGNNGKDVNWIALENVLNDALYSQPVFVRLS